MVDSAHMKQQGGKLNMLPSPHLFADRILNISIAGALVRLDLGTLQLPLAEGGKPSLRPTQTLVIPLDGFLASFSMLDAAVKKLIADGVLKSVPQAESSGSSEPRQS